MKYYEKKIHSYTEIYVYAFGDYKCYLDHTKAQQKFEQKIDKIC